jgi:hypothetical protein
MNYPGVVVLTVWLVGCGAQAPPAYHRSSIR